MYNSSKRNNWQLHTINTLDQGKWALKLPICGNTGEKIGKPSENVLPNFKFEVIHKSFHNLKQIFLKYYSH